MTEISQHSDATSVKYFRLESAALSSPVKVLKPVGEPVAEVRLFEVASTSDESTVAGVWECSPGKFERAVTQAEMCHFTQGEGSFTPEGGAAVDILPGMVMLFPANTRGVWNVRKTLRKVFVVFDP